MMSVPTMALAMPPPVSPTGFGICVKKSTFSAWMPFADDEEEDEGERDQRHRDRQPAEADEDADFALRQVADVMRSPRARPG
jgi:hypothetical protein